MERTTARLSRCPEARALLPAYVEGELAPAEGARVSRHLDICAACRAEEVELRRAFDALRARRPPVSPGDLYPGFAARMARLESKQARNRLRLRWAGAAACMAVAVGALAGPFAWKISRPDQTAHVAVMPPKATLAAPESAAIARRSAIQPAAPREMPYSHGAAEGAPVKPRVEWTPQVADGGPSIPFGPSIPIGPSIARRHRPAQHRRAVTRRAPPPGFLDVRPEVGPTAREQLVLQRRLAQLAARQPGARVKWSHHMPETASIDGARPVPRPALPPGLVPDRDERVQVGDTITRIETGYRLDKDGKRSMISVNIGTTRAGRSN